MSIVGAVTGRYRFRRSFAGGMVLVVEYFFTSAPTTMLHVTKPYPVYAWRDATAMDIADLIGLGVIVSTLAQKRSNDFPDENMGASVEANDLVRAGGQQ